MNRQQRRAESRKQNKQNTKSLRNEAMVAYKVTNNKKCIDVAEAMKWVDHLDRKHQDIINLLMEGCSNADLEMFSNAVDITLKNWMYEHGYDPQEELENIQKVLDIEGRYCRKFNDENEKGSYFMKLDKDRAVIIKDYEEMKKQFMKEGQILDSLAIKYSKYSKNAIKSVIKDYKAKNKKKVQATKKDVKKVLEEKKDDPDMKAIENYIFGDGEKTVVVKNATTESKNKKLLEDTKETVKTINKGCNEKILNNKPTENTEKPKEPKEPKKINSTLKVKSIVVEDEEGREYIKENGVVIVGTETFNGTDALEEYKTKELAAYKKSYDEKIAEINRAYDEEKVSFLKKINNIADVFMM